MSGDADPKPGADGKVVEPAGPAVEMVPKADLLRAYGEKGALTTRIKDLEGELAASKDREELRQKGAKSAPADDERKAFDDGVLAHRAEQRKLQEERAAFAAQVKQHESEKRSFLIARLVAEYPTVKAEELQALGETATAVEIELHAAKTQLARAPQAPGAKKGSLSERSLDTPGGASGAADKKGLTPQEKIRLGTQQFIERTAGAREALGAAPAKRGA